MNCGQVCICNERTFVHQDLYPRFLEAFVAQAKALRIGDPLDEKTDIGPKVSQDELEKVEAMVADADRARRQGRCIGGSRPKSPPTPRRLLVLADGPHRCQRPTCRSCRTRFSGRWCRSCRSRPSTKPSPRQFRSRYGLSAYLFTSDLRRVMRAVRDIDFGELYVNRIGPESLQGFHVGYRNSGARRRRRRPRSRPST